MAGTDKPSLLAAAEFACVSIHPKSLRADYVTDVRAQYSAESVVYVLQALSEGMTAIFLGLLTSYLYDKAKQKTSARETAKLKRLVRKQQAEIQRLKKWLKSPTGNYPKGVARRRLDVHERIIDKIEKDDPSINSLVEKAIRQLEKRGSEALTRDVDAHLP